MIDLLIWAVYVISMALSFSASYFVAFANKDGSSGGKLIFLVLTIVGCLFFYIAVTLFPFSISLK